jgi:hypothetical protein
MGKYIKLIVQQGDQKGMTHTLKGHERCVLGRMSDCAMRFKHEQISRCHCLLEWDGIQLRLRDFGSLNGTYVNGVLFDKRPDGMSREEAMGQAHNEKQLFHGDTLSLARKADVKVEICEEIVQKECIRCKKKFNPAGSVDVCPDCIQKERARIELQKILKPEKLQPDEIIPGYQCQRSLGKGGMGQVWLVKERNTGRVLALKQILTAAEQEEGAQLEFLREMEIACQIDHKYAVKVHAVGAYEGHPYLLMDYYAKGDMVTWLRTCGWGGNKYRTALDLFLQIAEGLAYMHHTELTVSVKGGKRTVKGIVHRDIKPWNIFVDVVNGKPVVKIADYGLAKAYTVAGQTIGMLTGNGMKGTVAFMPRQQIMDTRYAKPDVDVWAAAASIYFLLTGQIPKPRARGEDAISAALKNKAVPIRNVDPNVPKPLAEIIDRALQDQPGLYYKSGRELYEDLKKIQGRI